MNDIVILVSSLRHLVKKDIPFVFTDRHAYLRTAQFSNDLGDLDRIIWPSLQERDFKRDDTDKVDKYQAEALVHKHGQSRRRGRCAKSEAEIKVAVRKDGISDDQVYPR
jgi:hypothetical protein